MPGRPRKKIVSYAKKAVQEVTEESLDDFVTTMGKKSNKENARPKTRNVFLSDVSSSEELSFVHTKRNPIANVESAFDK